jgi:hypothetical protein
MWQKILVINSSQKYLFLCLDTDHTDGYNTQVIWTVRPLMSEGNKFQHTWRKMRRSARYTKDIISRNLFQWVNKYLRNMKHGTSTDCTSSFSYTIRISWAFSHSYSAIPRIPCQYRAGMFTVQFRPCTLFWLINPMHIVTSRFSVLVSKAILVTGREGP